MKFKEMLARLRWIHWEIYLRAHRRIVRHGYTKVRGKPILTVVPGAEIHLGDDLVLNSVNRGYHVNLFAPVKLTADRPGATISIGDRTRIHGSCIHCWKEIRIGQDCLIAGNCQILDSNAHQISTPPGVSRSDTQDTPRPVNIGNRVWLGTGVIVLPGVSIGDGSVVGAGSIVSKSIPANVLAAGNPARVLKSLDASV